MGANGSEAVERADELGNDLNNGPANSLDGAGKAHDPRRLPFLWAAALPGRKAAEDAGVMLAQPSKHQFAHGSERALRQSAEFDRFGSIKRRFQAHFVADPYTQHADRGPLRNRRD